MDIVSDSEDEKGEEGVTGFLELFAKGLHIDSAENQTIQADDEEDEDEEDFAEYVKNLNPDEDSYASTDEDEKTDDEDESDDSDDEEPLYDDENSRTPLHTVFFVLAMGDMLKHHDHFIHEMDEQDQIPTRGEEFFAVARGEKRYKPAAKNSSGEESAMECEGDRRVRKIRELWEKGFKTRVRPGDDPKAFKKIVPSDDQQDFLKWLLFSVLPRIYGVEEWPTHAARVLKEFDMGDEIEYFLMIVTARRVGKTWVICINDTALLLFVPGITIAVYSTGKRASEMLREQVRDFIEMTGPENKARIVVDSQEKLYVSHDLSSDSVSDGSTVKKRAKTKTASRKNPHTAKLHSYPTSKKGKGKQTTNKTEQNSDRENTHIFINHHPLSQTALFPRCPHARNVQCEPIDRR